MTAPWASYVEWTSVSLGEQTATVGDFVLLVKWHDQPYESAPSKAWHFDVKFKGITCTRGFSHDAVFGLETCKRSAVKMATFHGMPLPEIAAGRVGHLLHDPHGVPDPDNPGKSKPARRVAVDGHKPSRIPPETSTEPEPET